MDLNRAAEVLSKMRGEEQRLLHLHYYNEGRYNILRGRREDGVERTHKLDLANKDFDSLEAIRSIMEMYCRALGVEYLDRDLHDLTSDVFPKN